MGARTFPRAEQCAPALDDTRCEQTPAHTKNASCPRIPGRFPIYPAAGTQCFMAANGAIFSPPRL